MRPVLPGPQGRPSARPLRQPHPPIWVAANGDRAVARAGRLGLPSVINPHASLGTVRCQLGFYRVALGRMGHPEPADLPIIREVVVRSRRENVWELTGRYLWPKYRVYVEWGQDRALPAARTLGFSTGAGSRPVHRQDGRGVCP